MIEKIIEIKNIGHCVNFKSQGTKEWNGQFKKLNIVYAPNGSGKTTLSTILNSIAQNNLSLINFKRTIGSIEEPRVILKEYNNSTLIKLDSNIWSPNNLKLEVFDINYIEDYLFSGSFYRKQNKTNLFKLLLGEKGLEYRLLIKPLIHKKEKLINKLQHLHGDSSVKLELDEVSDKLENLINDLIEYSKSIYNNHIEIVNKYLEKFTSYIRLLEFRNDNSSNEFELFRIFPVFEVYNNQLVFSSPDLSKRIGNAKYSLATGHGIRLFIMRKF